MARHTRERRKELGAFYTPSTIAEVLVNWSLRRPEDTMLDPSFGGYVFLQLAKERLLSLGADRGAVGHQICGIDIDGEAVRIAKDDERLADCRLLNADFFSVRPSEELRFTANIGNPPYVRYQAWNGGAAKAHALMTSMGVRLTRLASLWAPFVLHGCHFLERGGRLAQVLPAELLHAQYARPVVQHLTSSFQSVTVAVFQERVFPGALEEVVLLFADGYGTGPSDGIGVVSCRGVNDLDLSRIDGKGRGYLDPDLGLLPILPRATQRLYEHLAAEESVKSLGDLASVDIGIVTGANDFFMRTRRELDERGFDPGIFRVAIGRATDIEGAVLSDEDVNALDAKGRPTALLAVDSGAAEPAVASVRSLIREGQKQQLHKRYKCRIRHPWYAVPLPKRGAPDGFLTYMSNEFPRFVANEAGAFSTNTVHNVMLFDNDRTAALAVSFYNSLTLLSAELVGRSYGGGVLKLEPTEAERLLIPSFGSQLREHLPEVDALIRRGQVNAALDIVDPLVLAPLGVSNADIAALRRARQNLFARRRARRVSRNGEAKANAAPADRRAEASR